MFVRAWRSGVFWGLLIQLGELGKLQVVHFVLRLDGVTERISYGEDHLLALSRANPVFWLACILARPPKPYIDSGGAVRITEATAGFAGLCWTQMNAGWGLGLMFF